MYGAAIAAVVANMSLVGLMIIRAQKVFYVKYEILRLLRPVLLLTAAIILAYFLPSGTGFLSWGSRLSIALLWPVLLVATGFISHDERVRIVKLMRRNKLNNNVEGVT